MILAAGHGVRLRPLTDERPKILVPVLGVPMLDRLRTFLARGGAGPLAMNTHHLPGAVRAHLARSGPALPPVRLFHEPTLLGTGGALRHAEGFWGDAPLLVWNGDIVSDVDPGALLAAHAEGGALATLAVQARPSDSCLLVDDAGRLCGLDSRRRRTRRLLREPAGTPRALAFNGVSVLAPGLRAFMPAGGAFDLVDVLLEAAAAGAPVRAQDAGAAFYGTTGSPDRLAALERGLEGAPAVLARWTP